MRAGSRVIQVALTHFRKENTLNFNKLTAHGIAALTLASACQASALQQPVVNVLPQADGFARDGDLGNFFNPPVDGVADSLYTGSLVQVLSINDGNNSGYDRGLIEFDISSFTGLQSATLILNRFGAKGPFPLRVDVYAYEGDGVITLSDFSAGTYTAYFDYTNQASVGVDVTQAVKQAVANGQSSIGFNLRMHSASTVSLNGPFVAFDSTEVGTTRPFLSVSVPEPASLGLIALGAPLLLRRRRGA